MTKNHLRIVIWISCALALTLSVRAEKEAANPSPLQMGDLSPAVQKTFLERSKGATIQHIMKTPATYSAQLDTKGQKSEVRVTEDGKVLRIRSKHEAEAHFEEEQRLAKAGMLNIVPLEDVPTAAKTVIVERSKGATIDQIVKTPATFTAQIDQAGQKNEVRVSDNGKSLD